MSAWFSENWWWLLPVILGAVVVAWAVGEHKAIATAMPEGKRWRSHIDLFAKRLLGAFAFLLAYTAFTSKWFLGLVPTIFMMAVLYTPIGPAWHSSNLARYAIYLGLFVLYVALWPSNT